MQNTQNYCHQCGFLTALECTKFVFGRGSAPDPALIGELTALPHTPYSWFKGTLLLRGGEGRRREGIGKGREGEGGKGMEGKGRGRGVKNDAAIHANKEKLKKSRRDFQ